MLISCAGVLALKCGEFGTRIFCLVLAGNYTMGKPLDIGVTLLNVLLKACDAVVSRL